MFEHRDGSMVRQFRDESFVLLVGANHNLILGTRETGVFQIKVLN